jgi:CHAT domain-containing protein/tetratricopeptide (TPR) repeat protein
MGLGQRSGWVLAAVLAASCIAAAGIAPAKAAGRAAYRQALAEASRDFELGDFVGAERASAEALRAAERDVGTDGLEWAEAALKAADIRERLGELSGAEPLYRRAMAIFERDAGLADVRVARALHGLARLYVDEQRDSEALALLARAADIADHQQNPDVLLMAGIRQDWGQIETVQGQADRAWALFDQAKTLVEGRFGPDHPASVASDNGFATVHYMRGEYDEAARLVAHGLAIRQRALGPDHPDIGMSLNQLGAIYFTQGRYAEAEPLWKRSLAIRIKAYGPSHRQVVTQYTNLGALHIAMGRTERALENYRKAAETLASQEMTDRQGSRWATEIDWGARITLGGLTSTAWQAAEREPSEKKALAEETFGYSQWLDMSRSAFSLAQMAARLRAGGPSSLVRGSQFLIRSRLQAEMSLTAALTEKPRDEEKVGRLRHTLQRIDRIQHAYEELKTRFGRLGTAFGPFVEQLDPSLGLAGPQPIGIAEARSALREDEALVRYLVRDDETFVWALTREDLRWERLPFGSGQLASAVAVFRHGLDPSGELRSAVSIAARHGSFDLGQAYQLYEAIWAPIAASVAGKRHVLIAPSGPLTALPFQALVAEPADPVTGGSTLAAYRRAHWLIRDHAISVLPFAAALSLLRGLPDAAEAPEPFLGVGDPDFGSCSGPAPAEDATPQAVAYADLYRGASIDAAALCTLVPLPETRGELAAAAGALDAGAADLLLGGEASERTLKAMSKDGSLARRRILMFATHGLVAGDIAGFAEPGLALTAPARPGDGDDGYLSAGEIADLRLNADWVVLSACNTAAGATPGAEALSGLASAFMYAGARALLVSHWAVYSDAAVALTTGTFRAMRSHPELGRAGALRTAMLAMIDGGAPADADPSRWAPFFVVGD